jgi:cysteine sulfinate desulfinase/cysteine desulfurase-like protein
VHAYYSCRKDSQENSPGIEDNLLENNIATINFENQITAPHIISASLINKDAEDFILEHASEFAISTGSACNSGINAGSHVYKHVFINKENINIRISIDHDR